MNPVASLLVLLLAAACDALQLPAATRAGAIARTPAPAMFFGPKGDPVELSIKTMKGEKKAKAVSGQPLIKYMGSSGLVYGCKEGGCGTCEVCATSYRCLL